MGSIRIRIERKTARSDQWETLEYDGDQMQSVPMHRNETPGPPTAPST